MDDFTQAGPELQEALRHLRRLNRWLGASGPVLYGVKRLWKAAGAPRNLTVLDVGSGSGDVNRAVLKWAERERVKLKVILTDVTDEARIEAERLFRNDPRVSFVRKDVFELPAGLADIVTASQFAHHFDADALPALVQRCMDISRYGAVIGDIHRHWIAWTAVWLFTRIVSANRYIRHDGPLSVAKGFRREDFLKIAGQLGLTDMDCRWRPLFRYAVAFPRRREEPVDGQGN
ncbi:methyltransferase domain-containing protein [Cohnella candidum]|uniref:Methyltransferase domain-containing protein n=1 Tax=Cohnella candidum TaxID=2674991 RepID=A0A3G3JVT2_9BACL|nr:methyltransferase domain-containing protein [Cohnella candidum]AYQ72336.1 methyltransferase domain-containing protein [Cohnella candidum]